MTTPRFPAYESYDQAALDATYNPRAVVADHATFFQRHARLSEAARRDLPCRLDLAYGPTPAERVDVFPGAAGGPILVYFHGGYWRSRDKADFSFVAQAWAPLGVTVVMANYALCPAVDMDTLIAQCRAAMGWTRTHARDLGGDGDRIFVAGHSAGAHIAVMMLLADQAGTIAPAPFLRGGTAISGLYDLEPVRRSYVNADLRLTPEQALRNSPIRHLPRQAPPLILTAGDVETAEFRRQSLDFAAAWQAAGLACESFEIPRHHHYSILDDFTDPQSGLVRSMREQIGV